MEIIEILKRLVKFNTIEDKENKEMLDYIEEYLKQFSFEVKRIGKCLIATNGDNPSIGFIGHTDTVNYENWDGNPFELQIKQDKLIGLRSLRYERWNCKHIKCHI